MNPLKGNRISQLACVALLSSWLSLPALAADGAPMVSVRGQHSLALSSDGKVRSWGSDQNGQLGSGARTFETRPGLVVGLGNVSAIASSYYFSLALGRDGLVWSWGTNYAHQLGDGSTRDRAVPGKVPGLDGVLEICTGAEYALARRADGSVWGWGSNYHLTLGAGPRPEQGKAGPVAGLQGVTQLACGDQHALALRADGTVLAWGRNGTGALGLGNTSDRANPTTVPGLSNVRALAAGQEISLALRADGTVWEWGASSPYTSPRAPHRLSPVQVAGISGAAQIAAGSIYGIAIGADKTNWWHWISGEAPVAQPTVGALNGAARAYGQGFLLKADGGALGFGALSGNGFGNLGDGTVDYREEPAPVVDIANLVQVVTGTWHGMALGADGRVWSWGLDASGQLGRGRFLHRSVPATVAGLPAVVQVSAGWDHSMALDASGSLWAWGGNGYAQLGNGSWADLGLPAKLTGISEVRAVLAGGYFTLALKQDGSLWGWGSALPLNLSGDPSVPTRLTDGVAGMAAGVAHVLVLRPDGTVAAWGDNAAGQLGDGTLEPRSAPTTVPGLTGVVAVAAMDRSSWALKADGSVWAWGNNEQGQIGGSEPRRLQPQPMAGLTGVVELAVGFQHAVVRRADGSLLGWFWGYNLAGELGSEQDQLGRTPRLLKPGNNRIAALAAGDAISAFVTQDGLVLMGGSNSHGQLGDGSLANAMRPVHVVDERATGFLNLKNASGSQASTDASLVLLRTLRTAAGLSALLTDLRAAGVVGELYFSALLPRAMVQAAAGPTRSARAVRPRADEPPGMTPVVFTRGGIKQSGPSTVAQASAAGALTAGTSFPVYSSELADPLVASNAIICIGVTVPELSAKGQVLMRPIATGDQVSGVAQCPTVQTAATLQRYTGQSSGPISARNLTASVEPLDEDRGQVRSVYSWAVTPDGRQYMQTSAGWAPMTEPMQSALTLRVPMSGPVTLPVTTGLDLSALVGTLVYVGLGASWEEVRSLNKAGHYYTVQ